MVITTRVSRISRALPAGIMLLALIVRLSAIGRFGPSVVRFGDAPDYLSAATSLCSAGSYPDRSSLPFFRAPGLPLFIAATTLCHTDAVWAVKLALAAAGVAGVAIIFLLTENLFRDRRASLSASAIAAIYPFFVIQCCDVQTEGLFMCLSLGAVWLTLRSTREASSFSTLLAGLCVGAAALVRPVGLVLLFLLPLAVFLAGAANLRGRFRSSLLLCAGAILCLGPWAIRNERRFHELILVDDAGGYNFWRGTSPEMAAISRITDAKAFTEASVHFETVITPAISREMDQSARTRKAGATNGINGRSRIMRKPRALLWAGRFGMRGCTGDRG